MVMVQVDYPEDNLEEENEEEAIWHTNHHVVSAVFKIFWLFIMMDETEKK